MNSLTLQSLPRNKLQKLAKEKGVKAVGKNADIIERILDMEAQRAVPNKPPSTSARPERGVNNAQEVNTSSSTSLIKRKIPSTAPIMPVQRPESNAGSAGPSTQVGTSMDGRRTVPVDGLKASVAGPSNPTTPSTGRQASRRGVVSQCSDGGSSAGARVRMHRSRTRVTPKPAVAPGEGSSVRFASSRRYSPRDNGSIAVEEIGHMRAAPLTGPVKKTDKQEPQDMEEPRQWKPVIVGERRGVNCEPQYHPPVFSRPLPNYRARQHDAQGHELPPRSPVFRPPPPTQHAQPVRRVPTQLELVDAETLAPAEHRFSEASDYHAGVSRGTREPPEERGQGPAVPMPRDQGFQLRRAQWAHRPTIAELQEKLYRLQPLVRQQSKTEEEIRQLLMLLDMAHKKEEWTGQKIKEIQMMRIALEEHYMAKTKSDPSLLGEGQRRWSRPDAPQEQDDSLVEEGLQMNPDPDIFLSAPVRDKAKGKRKADAWDLGEQSPSSKRVRMS